MYSTISRHWNGWGRWNRSVGKTMACLSYTVWTTAADALVTQRLYVLTQLPRTSSCNSKWSWWITHRPITNGVSHLLNLYFDCSVLSTQITIRFVSVFWLQGCHEPHMKGDAVVWVDTQYPMLLTWNLGSVVPLARKPFQQNSYNFTISIKRCNRSWSQSQSYGNRRLSIQTILKMIRQLHEF